MLFKRYASPLLLIDLMLRVGKFAEFIGALSNLDNEDMLWDFYLHKVFEGSFEDFKLSLNSEALPEVSNERIETTVNDSYSLLSGFVPR